MCAGSDVSPGSKIAQRERTTVHKKYEQQKKNLFKFECCCSYDQLPTERTKQKFCGFLSEIVSNKRLLSCSF
jgi:hypothetical protein